MQYVELRNRKDGEEIFMAVCVNDGGKAWFDWLPCIILKHAKTTDSVQISGEAFGKGVWYPGDSKTLSYRA